MPVTDDLELPIERPERLEIVLRKDHDRIVADLRGEIERLTAEVTEGRQRELTFGNQAAKFALEIERLRAALQDARTFVAGMVKPASLPSGTITISSHHPCHALLDKIDAALASAGHEQKAPAKE